MLTVQMSAEGSIGTPTYKQIIMQNQRQQAKEGVRITGNDRLKQSGGRNKGKTQVEDNDTSSNKILERKEAEGLEDNEDRNASGQNLTGGKEKQPGAEEVPTANRRGNKEKEGGTSSSPNKETTTNGICKPRKAESLRVVITDPAIQAYREHMAEHAVICKFMGMWPTERALCQWIR